ncbi:MAG TPA: hypothetical protein VKQ30_06745 [Ktedonobacterales bacterium]|nr:hypothetical protein [Ktedonobacterales bacterium]
MNEQDPHSARREQESQAAAETDRADLLAILNIRFGALPDMVRNQIEACRDLDRLERLILVAANVPTWQVFLDELASGSDEFKVVGARFDPLSSTPASASGAVAHGESNPQPEKHLIQLSRRKEN